VESSTSKVEMSFVSATDRRVRNPALRITVDELIGHLRMVSGRVEQMSDDELAAARKRLETITEMLWPAVVSERRR
jgi:hypothetical protein